MIESNAYNEHYVQSNYEGQKVQTFTLKTCNQRKAMAEIQPSTNVPANIFSASHTLDYRIQDPISRIHSACLRIEYINGASSATVGTISKLLKSVQIYANNGRTLVYQQDGSMVIGHESYLIHSQEAWDNNVDAFGSSTTYSESDLVLATSMVESTYFYIPIAPLFWSALKPRMYSLSQNLLVRIRFEDDNQVSGGTTLTTPSVVLLCSGYYENQGQEDHILSNLSIPKVLPFYTVQRNIETLTLAASTQYSIRLSGIHGHCPLLCFALRLVSEISTKATQHTMYQVRQYDITDSKNKSLLGHRNYSHRDMLLEYSRQFPNLLVKNRNIHVVSFSQAPLLDLKTGSLNGAVQFDGFNHLVFTTPAGLSGGSYEVLVWAYTRELAMIEDGELTTTRT